MSTTAVPQLDAATLGPVAIGIIGGSGLYSLDNLKPIGEVNPLTPWGRASEPILICETRTGGRVAFLPRHGRGHRLTPSEVNSRANIAALKHLGVRCIIAFSAVGSLQEELAPGCFVLPDQGIRPSTFFENGIVGHVGFADPFSAPLATMLAKHSASQGIPTHCGNRTLIAMEGPAFSTRAESNMYRLFNASVINMSAIPEAKLAREAEIAYQMVCMVTDYDCWREHEEAVTVETVVATMSRNSSNAKRLLESALPELEAAIQAETYNGEDLFLGVRGAARICVQSAPEMVTKDAAERIRYILPEYTFTK